MPQGILANQNINDYDAITDSSSDSYAAHPAATQTRWTANLGSGREYADIPQTGFGGFQYGPPGLDVAEAIPPTTNSNDKFGSPAGGGLRSLGVGKTAEGVVRQTGYSRFQHMQYGPAGFAQLQDAKNPTADSGQIYGSLLGALAYMVASPEAIEWDDRVASAGGRMKETFTSGKQTASLDITGGPLGTDGLTIHDASGGLPKGYQYDHVYGISNWDASGLGKQVAAATPVNAEIRQPDPDGQSKTGLRNIKDMQTA